MKRNIIIVAALAIAGLCSCQKEDLPTTKNIIDATVEAASDDASKTTVGEDFSLNWASGDKFEVYKNDNLGSKAGVATLTGGEGTKNGKFEFSTEATLSNQYIAYYPYYSEENGKHWVRPTEGGKLSWTLNSYILDNTHPMPMFGTFTSANSVSFKPVYSVLRFVSKSGKEISKVKYDFRSAGGYKNNKTVYVDSNGNITYATGGDDNFTLDSDMGLFKPFTVSGGQKITVTVTYSDSTSKTYTIKDLGIQVGHIKTFKVD